MKRSTLFIVAAGSGGHMLPALQCARTWLADNPGGWVEFFTGTSALEQKIVADKPFITTVHHMAMGKFSLRRWWLLPIIALQALRIFCQAFYYALRLKPDVVISTGGLLSVPVCIAARLARRRVEVYELNLVPGKAVSTLMPFANVIHIVFPQTRAYCHWRWKDFAAKCHDAAYPIRFTQADRNVDKATIIDTINQTLHNRGLEPAFATDRKTLFVLGGSQGSVLLNTLTKKLIESHAELAAKIQVIHQTGPFDETSWVGWYQEQQVPALTFSYDERINQFYVLADLIVCRAGAGTMFEIAFFKRPCVVIPLVAATTGHQVHNALAMAELHPHLFHVLKQDDVVANNGPFFTMVEQLLQ
jgi:UDP-N-acetylglucosamine--N-acetylmuramyl-(pentapeptide) pyrophosphoryl-undecaprenol N-acetylglucosamine transferase